MLACLKNKGFLFSKMNLYASREKKMVMAIITLLKGWFILKKGEICFFGMCESDPVIDIYFITFYRLNHSWQPRSNIFFTLANHTQILLKLPPFGE